MTWSRVWSVMAVGDLRGSAWGDVAPRSVNRSAHLPPPRWRGRKWHLPRPEEVAGASSGRSLRPSGCVAWIYGVVAVSLPWHAAWLQHRGGMIPGGPGTGDGMTDIDTWEWFGNRNFHHSQFEPPAKLRAAKERLGLTISVCLPTRDEAATVGGIVRSLRRNLLERSR